MNVEDKEHELALACKLFCDKIIENYKEDIIELADKSDGYMGRAFIIRFISDRLDMQLIFEKTKIDIKKIRKKNE